MLSRIRAAMAERDKADRGFTLIELLVVVIIIGILAAIAIPVFMNQKAKAYDSSVKADLKSFATGAETYAADFGSYGTGTATSTGVFATQGGGATAMPIASAGNSYIAYTTADASGTPGYVIYGKNANSANVWVLSSFNGSAPKKISTTGTPYAWNYTTPATAPAAGDIGATGVTFRTAAKWAPPTTP